MNIPADLLFLRSHEWCRVAGDLATFGISDFAQDQLGDIVYVELPAVGSTVTAGEPFGSIESVKAAEDLNAPVSGEVVAVNDVADQDIERINTDPYGAGWLVQVRLSDAGELGDLLDAAAYLEVCEAEH